MASIRKIVNSDTMAQLLQFDWVSKHRNRLMAPSLQASRRGGSTIGGALRHGANCSATISSGDLVGGPVSELFIVWLPLLV